MVRGDPRWAFSTPPPLQEVYGQFLAVTIARGPQVERWCAPFACSGNRALVVFTERYFSTRAVRRSVGRPLEAIATFAQPGDRDLAELAIAELDHPEPLVRAAAFTVGRHYPCFQIYCPM